MVKTAMAVVMMIVLGGGAASAATPAPAAKKKLDSAARERKVRDELHRNLDGKGGGFVQGFTFDSKVFTLTVDKRNYKKNSAYIAAMMARAIFDVNHYPLPTKLVFRDISGEVLGEGPFASVPPAKK
ncbi:MAG TPA: hypothetical protein VF698_09860 [Thermoanaerobaculia bacterium]